MVSRRTYRRSSFGKRRKTHRRRGGKKKRAAIKGRKVAYVRSKGAYAKKVIKKRNKAGRIVWVFKTGGKKVPKGRRKYKTKAEARGRKKTTTRHKKKRARRAHFGSFGQGRPSTLLQMIGPYAPSSFGRRRRRTTRRRPALRRRRY